jgi:hypothetical protein
VVVQSTAGRFGRAHCADAAAAEELLATLAVHPATPGPRRLAIAWDRSPETAAVVAAVVVGSNVGIETVVTRAGWCPPDGDDDGGLDTEPLTGQGALLGAVRDWRCGGLRVQTDLRARAVALALEETGRGGVVPETIGLEAVAEAATLAAPGWHVSAIEQAEFLAPVSYLAGEPPSLDVEAFVRPDGKDLVAQCRLVGDQDRTYLAARVRLTSSPPPSAASRPVPGRCVGALSADDIYRVYARTAPFRVLAGAWRTNAAAVGQLAPARSDGEDALVSAPRLVELCLQTAQVFETGRRGRLAAAVAVDRLILAGPGSVANGSRLYAVVRPSSDNRASDERAASFDGSVVDDAGRVYLEMRGCRTVALDGAPDAAGLAAFRNAMA